MDPVQLTSKEFEKYNKRCDIIKNLILKKYINTTFEFIRHPNTLCVEVVINNNSKISLLPDNTWDEVKRHINKKIIGFTGDCIICYTKMENAVSCPRCSTDYCCDCYIKIFQEGKGIITCPHCRYSYGNMMPEYMVKMGIDKIKNTLGK